MRVSVDVIESLDGITVLHQAVIQARKDGNIWDACSMEIYENSTKTTWINGGGFNHNPWDLWLTKKGTKGTQTRTFKRLSVGKNLGETIEFAKRVYEYR